MLPYEECPLDPVSDGTMIPDEYPVGDQIVHLEGPTSRISSQTCLTSTK